MGWRKWRWMSEALEMHYDMSVNGVWCLTFGDDTTLRHVCTAGIAFVLVAIVRPRRFKTFEVLSTEVTPMQVQNTNTNLFPQRPLLSAEARVNCRVPKPARRCAASTHTQQSNPPCCHCFCQPVSSVHHTKAPPCLL